VASATEGAQVVSEVIVGAGDFVAFDVPEATKCLVGSNRGNVVSGVATEKGEAVVEGVEGACAVVVPPPGAK
jgi:hypothetical protein